MPLGYHIIFGAYGFWLPNDPRGSQSTFVGSYELLRYGPATKTSETRSLAHVPHSHAARLEAKLALKYPPVLLTGVQARAVGRGIGDYVRSAGVAVWACAILRDHVHLVTGPLRIPPEQTAIQLKAAATRRLEAEGIHPLAKYAADGGRPPKCWARGEWKVFLDEEEDVERTVRYVEENPVKEGLPRQRWSFVREYR